MHATLIIRRIARAKRRNIMTFVVSCQLIISSSTIFTRTYVTSSKSREIVAVSPNAISHKTMPDCHAVCLLPKLLSYRGALPSSMKKMNTRIMLRTCYGFSSFRESHAMVVAVICHMLSHVP